MYSKVEEALDLERVKLKLKRTLLGPLWFFAFVAVFSAGEVLAAEERYSCTFTKRSARGPVPDKMSINLTSDGFEMYVQDEFTRQISANPIRADVVSLHPNKMVGKWQLVGLSYRAQNLKVSSEVVDYRLSFNRQNLKVNVSAMTRRSFSSKFGEGICVRL